MWSDKAWPWGVLGRIYGGMKSALSLQEDGAGRGSQMAGGTSPSVGEPSAPSILSFMTLSAAEAGGLRCCPLRCPTAGRAHVLQTYSSVGRSAVVWRPT